MHLLIPDRSDLSRRVLCGLALVLLARLCLHVVFVPPFEGPDEPFHSSRVAAVAHGPFRSVLHPPPLSVAVQRAIPRHPCGPDLRRAFGCPPFPGTGAGTTAGAPPAIAQPEYPNYENNQPPLYYAVAGGALALSEAAFPPNRTRVPESQLIRLRVISLLLVAAAIFGPLRRLARARTFSFSLVGMSVLFLPGFSESFVRCSNDAMLFLWAAIVVELVDRGYRGPALPALLALGCLIKLNALPVLLFALAVLWWERRRGMALVSVAAAVLPALFLGGSTWGGAVKIANRIPRPMPAGEVARGLGRSIYTILKGIPWMGEWSFFRPPLWLLALGLALVVALALRLRIQTGSVRFPAHVVGFAVALAGTLAFVLADRRVFGVWGGVGGWYVWSWMPWLALLASDTIRRTGRTRFAILGIGIYLIVLNVSWILAADRVYGPFHFGWAGVRSDVAARIGQSEVARFSERSGSVSLSR